MNEFDNIIESSSVKLNTETESSKDDQVQTQIDTNLQSMQISLFQIRRIINILNSKFLNGNFSDNSSNRLFVRPYFELFQSIMRCFKPIELILQNPEIHIVNFNRQYEMLFTNFVNLFLKVTSIFGIPNQLFLSVCHFFSPLLIIFVKNLKGETSNLSKRDFLLFLQVSESSMDIFQHIFKKRNLEILEKFNLIDVSKLNNTIRTSYQSLKDLLTQVDIETFNQSETIENAVLDLRSTLILYGVDQMEFQPILFDIQSHAKIGQLIFEFDESFKKFADFLKTNYDDIQISTAFHYKFGRPKIYSNIIEFESKLLNVLSDTKVATHTFKENGLLLLNEAFNKGNSQTVKLATNIINSQLLLNDNLFALSKDIADDDSILNDDDPKDDNQNNPFDACFQNLRDFLLKTANREPVDEKKLHVLLFYQFFEIIKLFVFDNLNRPTKTKIDNLTELSKEMSMHLLKISSLSRNEFLSNSFFSVFMHSIDILLCGLTRYQSSTSAYNKIILAYKEIVPPMKCLEEAFNIESHSQRLQEFSQFLFKQNESLTQSTDVINDDLLNNTSILASISQNVVDTFTFEINVASEILSFLNAYYQFLELLDISDQSTQINWAENTIRVPNENDLQMSKLTLSLFQSDEVNFNETSDFFCFWITYSFSLINRSIEVDDIFAQMPFCDFSRCFETIVNSSNLVEIYSRISKCDKLINNSQRLRTVCLALFLSMQVPFPKFYQIVQECVNLAQPSPTILKKIICFSTQYMKSCTTCKQLFRLSEIANSINKEKLYMINDSFLLNYALTISHQLLRICNSKLVDNDISETLLNLAQSIQTKVRENNYMFFAESNSIVVQVFAILNQVRLTMKHLNSTFIIQPAMNFVNQVISFFEQNENDSYENLIDTFKPILYAIKKSIDQIRQSRAEYNIQLEINKMAHIIYQFKNKPSELDTYFKELIQAIQISNTIYSIKSIIVYSYLILNQLESFEGQIIWFDGEFDQYDIYLDEDQGIDTEFLNWLYASSKIRDQITDFLKRLDRLLQVSPKFDRKDKVIGFRRLLSQTFIEKLTEIESRVVPQETTDLIEEVQRLDKEFKELCEQDTKEQIPVITVGEFKLSSPKIDKILNEIDIESTISSSKAATINELNAQIGILKNKIDIKKQDLIEMAKKNVNDPNTSNQPEKFHQLIDEIREIVSKAKMPPVNSEEVEATIDMLIEKLTTINQENELLIEKVKFFEDHHQPSYEDQVKLIMRNPNSFKQPVKTVQGNDNLQSQIDDLTKSIKRMKKRLDAEKPDINDDDVEVLKEIRPRGFPDTLIEDSIYKKFVRTTRERAEVMKNEWIGLRNELKKYINLT